jgi:SinI restriction endonuclease
MMVNFDTLIKNSISEDTFLDVFKNAFSQQKQVFLESHRTILAACYQYPDLAPSPKKMKGQDPESLAKIWLKKYQKSFECRISQRTSKSPGTIADPIVNTIISTRLTRLTSENLAHIEYAHRLSMSAENILGLLLEEFLAENLIDYGWHCCWGEIVRNVDFCNVNGSLLQVKNRSNSENSASASVRKNHTDEKQVIEKWHRVDAKTGAYKWSYFNDKYETARFSEDDFVAFVRNAIMNNPEALAVEANNPWKFMPKSSD